MQNLNINGPHKLDIAHVHCLVFKWITERNADKQQNNKNSNWPKLSTSLPLRLDNPNLDHHQIVLLTDI